MNGITKMGRALTQMLLPVVLAVAPILAHAEEVGTEGSKPNPLTEFQPGLLIWTWITFLLLLAVLTWKAWPPITKALKAREDAVRDAIALARAEREAAAKLLSEHKQLIADARKETAALVDQGRRDAEKVRAELMEKARKEQEEYLANGRRQIQQETKTAITEMQSRVVDLALSAAEKLVLRTLDPATHRALIEQNLKDMSQVPGPKTPGTN